MKTPKEQKEKGISDSINHANAIYVGWSDMAYLELVAYAKRTAKPFTSYQFRSDTKIESPTTPKAFGSVFLRAAKAGEIIKVGFAPHPERHLSPTPVWSAAL